MIMQSRHPVNRAISLLLIATSLLFGLFALATQSKATSVVFERKLELWYRQPAKEWVEALPVGNGRLGAMVFGGVATEAIQLNEDTVWAGPPVPQNKPGAYKYLPEIRRLLFDGKYAEGEALVRKELLGINVPGTRSYQTLGN